MEVKEPSARYLARRTFRRTEIGMIPEDWDVKALREISPSQSVGLVINPSTYVDVAGTVPMLVGSDIQENRILWESARRITDESNDRLPASRLSVDDIVTVRVGAPGVTAVVPYECDGCNCASMMIVRRHRSFKSSWLCYLMNSRVGREQVANVQYGTAQKQFNISDAVDFKFPVPPLAEQETIAKALSDADALIESLEQLITKKRRLKQGAMQELLTGKRRLPGFSGQWDRRQIGDLLTIAHGRSQSGIEDKNGEYPILATGGQIGTTNRFLHNKPSVLIGRKGTIDKPQFMDTPFWTVDTLFYSVIHEPNCAKFLYYRFCLIDWKQFNEASGVPSLNARTIEHIEIMAPQGEEQTAIAAILSDMDADITALETKLSKARHLKQGMMQQLLTGKIRLV